MKKLTFLTVLLTALIGKADYSNIYSCAYINSNRSPLKLEWAADYTFKISSSDDGKVLDQGTLLDQSESLSVIYRELGFQYLIFSSKERTEDALILKTSSGKLLIADHYPASGNNPWSVKFDPNMVCSLTGHGTK